MYFVTTIMDKYGKVRVRPISNQHFPDGGTIKTHFNVSCDKEARVKFPLGTIFACRNLEDQGKFYKVPDFTIYPVSDSGGTLLPERLAGSIKAYTDFLAKTTGVTTEPVPEVDTPAVADTEELEEPKPRTILERIKAKAVYKPPKLQEKGFFIDEDIWYLLLRNIRNKKNTLLVGPTGSGKTELLRLLAEQINKTYSVYDMGSMHDPMTGLLGVHRINSDGYSTFDYSKFSKDIQDKDIIILDELSRAPQTTSNILLPCLDSRRELPIEIASSTGVRNIPVGETTTFFATANIGSEYTGSGIMDRALVDRFFIIEMDYLTVVEETKVLCERTGIQKEIAQTISRVADSIRGLWRKGDLSLAVSTRHTLEVAALVADGFSLLQSFEFVFLPLYEGTNSEGERSQVRTILATR